LFGNCPQYNPHNVITHSDRMFYFSTSMVNRHFTTATRPDHLPVQLSFSNLLETVIDGVFRHRNKNLPKSALGCKLRPYPNQIGWDRFLPLQSSPAKIWHKVVAAQFVATTKTPGHTLLECNIENALSTAARGTSRVHKLSPTWWRMVGGFMKL
jgi:hypothetical protein